ncbi:trypsin-like peptidase domain-containing protein [Aurantimonas sp. VKM B-3413]|uniref:trypsin-like peptidase domain-containing protein n=1 Tax=Aurantimonas sp. VKM B-3413 TaxID=2779401 RepID=UPI001E2B6F03|nr:trypsin-like peptidase domain-containing protein [Aurantimonas sp. VKM B-3413]MCB8840158.1 trypsin-like peptidase domain-containing protein [Aurantimonas sp. VKM B-3413]
MLEGVLPGVVSIDAVSEGASAESPMPADSLLLRFFDLPENSPPQTYPTQRVGSGMIVDAAKGFILTNSHLVDRAIVIAVVLSDGRAVQAEIVGSDPETDLAVIKIEADGLTEIPFGDSGQLRVGDYVIAVGSPFGLGQSATLGIVCALCRADLGLDSYEKFIQTDASINPGSSGGARVDLDGAAGAATGAGACLFAGGGHRARRL